MRYCSRPIVQVPLSSHLWHEILGEEFLSRSHLSRCPLGAPDAEDEVRKKDMQKISVIVPFYNAKTYLRSCITALLAQDYPVDDYEVILVDNNSTDGSAEIAKQFSRIKVLVERRQGAYAARNKGLAEAGGTIIAFTDADCVPERDWLCTIAKAMRPAQVYIVLGYRQWSHTASTLLSMLEAHENQKAEFITNSQVPEIYIGYTNNMAVRREVFDTIGVFVERLRGSDTIFVLRTVQAYSCAMVRYEPTMRVRHLELNSIWKHYQKMWIYGRSSRLSQPLIFSRPLTRLEASQVFRETVRRKGYSPVQGSVLYLLIKLEALSYGIGQWAGKWVLWSRSMPSRGSRREL